MLQATGANDVEVEWTPKDSRGNWRKEKLPKSIRLRLLTYHAKGFRPLRLLTNVLDNQDVPYEQFWNLTLSEEGEVLSKGAYNLRWEIETDQPHYTSRQRWCVTGVIPYDQRQSAA